MRTKVQATLAMVAIRDANNVLCRDDHSEATRAALWPIPTNVAKTMVPCLTEGQRTACLRARKEVLAHPNSLRPEILDLNS